MAYNRIIFKVLRNIGVIGMAEGQGTGWQCIFELAKEDHLSISKLKEIEDLLCIALSLVLYQLFKTRVVI